MQGSAHDSVLHLCPETSVKEADLAFQQRAPLASHSVSSCHGVMHRAAQLPGPLMGIW